MITNLIRTSLVLFFLIESNFGIGQESSSIQSFAISPRAGIYGSSFKKHPIEGALVGIEANVELKRVLFAADYYYFNEMSFFSPSEELNQLGILVGQQFGKRYFRFNYLAGPSYLWGHKEISQTYKTTDSWGNSIYKTNTFSMLYGAIGVELKVGCHWLLTRYFGLGFDIHGNINADQPILFPVITLEFGKLRRLIEK